MNPNGQGGQHTRGKFQVRHWHRCLFRLRRGFLFPSTDTNKPCGLNVARYKYPFNNRIDCERAHLRVCTEEDTAAVGEGVIGTINVSIVVSARSKCKDDRCATSSGCIKRRLYQASIWRVRGAEAVLACDAFIKTNMFRMGKGRAVYTIVEEAQRPHATQGSGQGLLMIMRIRMRGLYLTPVGTRCGCLSDPPRGLW